MKKSDKSKQERDFFLIAVIIGAHGIRGELRLKALSEETAPSDLKRAYLLSPDESTASPIKLSAKVHKNVYIARLDGVDTRDDAEALKSYYIAIARQDAAELPEGRYYIADLMGSKVFDLERGEIGVFDDSISSPGADIFVIKRKGMKDLLVPILEDSQLEVDLAKKEIKLKLPEGLWEIYD